MSFQEVTPPTPPGATPQTSRISLSVTSDGSSVQTVHMNPANGTDADSVRPTVESPPPDEDKSGSKEAKVHPLEDPNNRSGSVGEPKRRRSSLSNPIKPTLLNWKQKIMSFFWEDLSKEGPERICHVGDSYQNLKYEFRSNYVRTTKYTLLTFIPKNIYEQLQKAANFYFFVLAVLVSIPGVSPIAAWTQISPLVFVLTVSAIREAIEDYTRYQNDLRANNMVSEVIRDGEVVSLTWSQIVVGDIVKVYNGEFFPADMIMLASSIDTGECSIETSNLDGETNLKQRQSLRQTAKMGTDKQMGSLRATVCCELPNSNLHYFQGVWSWKPLAGAVPEENEFPITHEELLMRGTKLMNTDFVYGLVIYTGHETKLMLNLNHPRHKITRVESITNRQMYYIFVILFVTCFIFAVIYGVTRSDRIGKDWYLGYDVQQELNSSGLRDFTLGVRDWAAFLILYSLMVPISLYVSMELVRVAQAFWIWLDVEMYDAKSDTRAMARAAALNEQLGEIDYVFCDKTGTLTENQMAFAKCSIGGKAYGDEEPKRERSESEKASDAHMDAVNEELMNKISFPEVRMESEALHEAVLNKDQAVADFLTALAVCHTVTPVKEEEEILKEEERQKRLARNKQIQDEILHGRKSESKLPQTDEKNSQENIELANISNEYKTEAQEETQEQRDLRLERSVSSLHDFSLGKVAYMAASPDEMALVKAARVYDYFFHTRERDSIIVETPQGDRRYQILHVLEFSSERKRMSVIVREPDNSICLYSKGADSVIMERLDPSAKLNPEKLKQVTHEHLMRFSKEGLRVMCVARKRISEEEFESWNEKYKEASLSMKDRQRKMDSLANVMESGLELLGSTAIEDKLQEGVPQAIASLRAAGLKVWILTGDKLETAVNIGKSCALLENVDILYAATGTQQQTDPARSKRDSVFSIHDFETMRGAKPNFENVLGDINEKKAQVRSRASSKKQLPQVNEHVEFKEEAPEDSNPGPEDGQTPSFFVNQLSYNEQYVLKVQAAKNEAPIRENEIGRNLDRILKLMISREELKKRYRKNEQDVPAKDKAEFEHAQTGTALVIDGPTLGYALTSNNEAKFVEVIHHPQCKVVVCARLAPMQKARVVDIVKEHIGAITLAIGDGANDVSMIQTAHVGIGISGKEGMQAVNASDYSIAQFQFLAKLILVHGRWSYIRNITLILYFFYKGFAISWTQLWLTIHTSFSDQEIFDGVLLNSFNLFWTSMPILLFASFDRDVEATDLMKYPELYRVRDNFNEYRFWQWAGTGFLHSLVCFFLPFYVLDSTFHNNSFWSMSIATYSTLVMVVTVKLAVMHNSFTWINVLFLVLSPTVWWIFAFTYTSEALMDSAPHAFQTMAAATREDLFWLALLLAITLSILPDLTLRFIERYMFPNSKVIIQERRGMGMGMPDRPTDVDAYREQLEREAQQEREAKQAAKTSSSVEAMNAGAAAEEDQNESHSESKTDNVDPTQPDLHSTPEPAPRS